MNKQLFFSYSRKDQDAAYTIKNEIEQHIGSGLCWLDIDSISSDEDTFDTAIIGAILTAEIILLILSKNSIESSYVKKEIQFATKKNKKIIPISIDGTNPNDWDWWLFNFGQKEYIVWNSAIQKEKLLNDLYTWLYVSNPNNPYDVRIKGNRTFGVLFH